MQARGTTSASPGADGRELDDRALDDREPDRREQDDPDDDHEPGRRAAAGSAGAAVRDYLLEQVSALHWAVADGDVHDARVACRRARSALLVHVDLVAGPRRVDVRAVAGRARDLGRELSAARDEEVVEEVVRGWAAEAAWPRDRLDGALRLLGPTGAADGAVDRAKDGLLALSDEVAGLAPSPLWGPAGAEPVVPGLAANRAQEVARLARRVDAARAAGADPAHDTRWHDVRKAAKRLRYTAEVAHQSGDLGAGEQATAARRVQTALGDLQDLQCVRTRLDEVAVGVTRDAGVARDADVALLAELGDEVDRAAAAARRDVDAALAEALVAVVGGSRGPTAPVPEDQS